jgi:NAD(P)-dependent dehydrogenase (short-subunit alcohol dehydrogenase family)
MSKPLEGKVALVTGGSRGIGRAIAEKLAADGATVAVHFGRNGKSAEDVVTGIQKSGGKAFAVGADLTAKDAATKLFGAFDAEAKKNGGSGKLDVLVNNAGVAPLVGFAETTEAQFDELIAVNVRAPFFIAQEAVKRLNDGGRIVNLSSVVARLPAKGLAAYSMTKPAIDSLTKSLAFDLGARNINVNAVAPGVIQTDMTAAFTGSKEADEGVMSGQALKRIGQADDIADVVAFLAGPGARWITGQTLEVSGGTTVTL